MRFMILVKATRSTEAGVMPTEELLSDQVKYHEELANSGVLYDVTGLKATSHGWRIKYAGGERTVINGPFTGEKDLIAGYTIIQVASREEAMEWTMRYPKPSAEDEVASYGHEVWQLQGADPENPYVAPLRR